MQDSVNIIFFDGVCVLCNGFANFVLKYDTKRYLKLAPLQGVKAQLYLGDEDLKKMDSILFYKDGQVFRATDAVFEILNMMGGAWRYLAILKIFPRFIRDSIYYFIAKNRYLLFGKRDSCRLPTAQEKERFLD